MADRPAARRGDVAGLEVQEVQEVQGVRGFAEKRSGGERSRRAMRATLLPPPAAWLGELKNRI